mmetsp:Transcript_45108/g.79373  ORF Transcript_45108/g.79373 Transcript_45108/m.79373 type:complete len:209 (+) Transcript_45108:43-669(+)
MFTATGTQLSACQRLTRSPSLLSRLVSRGGGGCRISGAGVILLLSLNAVPQVLLQSAQWILLKRLVAEDAAILSHLTLVRSCLGLPAERPAGAGLLLSAGCQHLIEASCHFTQVGQTTISPRLLLLLHKIDKLELPHEVLATLLSFALSSAHSSGAFAGAEICTSLRGISWTSLFLRCFLLVGRGLNSWCDIMVFGATAFDLRHGRGA